MQAQMKNKDLLLILGNQLFPLREIKKVSPGYIFMAEDFGLCTYEKHHKLKILMFLCAMREKRDELIKENFKVYYSDINNKDFKVSYEDKLNKYISKNDIEHIKLFEIEDKDFEKRIINFTKDNNLKLTIYKSPMFLTSREEFKEFNNNFKSLQLRNFYKQIRIKLNILIDNNKNPIGGKWSFDDENRKKIPKGLALYDNIIKSESKYINQLLKDIENIFRDHPGDLNNIWFPLTRSQAIKQLDVFLKNKLKNFGPYEDSIFSINNFLFHSGLSASLNIGIITPKDVIQKTLSYVKDNNIPLNSLEGFLRQIIGWREFIRGVYQVKGIHQKKSNFFNFSRKLNENWYLGNTLIPPLDDAIKFTNSYGYTHHINRLMVISNIMTLSEVHPDEVYKWFMEMYIDSSEWVMVPNVYGMGTYADGGIFSTKPYICGSNYILKMSNYKKDNWCDIVDGLYWRFIDKYFDKIKNNHRLSFIKRNLKNIDKNRKQLIFELAENFIERNTYIS